MEEEDVASLDASYESCLNGGTAQDGSVINPCIQDYNADPQFAAQVDQFAAETCGSSAALTNVYCGNFGFGEKCDCADPPGEACVTDRDCDGDMVNGLCVTKTDPDTGATTGYCVWGPCDAGSNMAGAAAVGSETGCGEDGLCLNIPTERGVASLCYRLCSESTDCREDYACEVIGFFTDGSPAGYCQPRCSTNADCPQYANEADPDAPFDGFCSAAGVCEPPCDPNMAESCGTGDGFTCTARTDFNAGTTSTGSCALSGN